MQIHQPWDLVLGIFFGLTGLLALVGTLYRFKKPSRRADPGIVRLQRFNGPMLLLLSSSRISYAFEPSRHRSDRTLILETVADIATLAFIVLFIVYLRHDLKNQQP